MRKDALTKTLLAVIAVALIAIAIRPYIAPTPAQAQSSSAYPFYIEPGVVMLHRAGVTENLYGRVVVDMRSGKIWGFPTGTIDTYPSNSLEEKPITSHPLYLGKFAFDEIEK
jgi:hypothetical protein